MKCGKTKVKTELQPRAHSFLTTREVVQTALMTALLLVVKEAMCVAPANVELVTVLIMVSAVSLRPRATLLAVLAFCTVQPMLWGYGYWVVSYFIYWPLLALAAMPLRRVKNAAARTVAAVLLAAAFTAMFGVLTSAVEVLFIWGAGDFATYFPVNYLRGLLLPYPFFLVHIASSIATVGLLFYPLARALKQLKND